MFAAIRRASSRVSRPIAMRRPVSVLEINVGQRLPLGVPDAEAFGGLVDPPCGVKLRLMSSAAERAPLPLSDPTDRRAA
jgi:hypothetical protein